MLSSKSTKRGFGSCLQCGHSYFTLRKPPNCEECGYDLGEQTSRLPRNQSGTVQEPFCSWVRLTFLARRARRTIVVSSLRKGRVCFALNSSVWICEPHLLRLDVQQTFPANSPTFAWIPFLPFSHSICPPQKLTATMVTVPPKNHCLLC